MSDNKPLLRKEVHRFAHLMEDRLRDNDHKGGWSECSKQYLHDRMFDEFFELADALFRGKGNVNLEAADVANFAMMIADNFGSDDPPKKEPS